MTSSVSETSYFVLFATVVLLLLAICMYDVRIAIIG